MGDSTQTRVLQPGLAGQVREDSRTDRAPSTRRTASGSTRNLLSVLMTPKEEQTRNGVKGKDPKLECVG